MDSELKTGTVKFFNTTKGYGFIREVISGEEYFVHYSGLRDSITKDDLVTFTLIDKQKGPQAVEVTLTNVP